jgi:uncharacterized protein (DUF1330 family)
VITDWPSTGRWTFTALWWAILLILVEGVTTMKTALAMLTGVAIGALAIQGLHAQQTPGAPQLPRVIYVAEIDVSNPEGYGKEFAPKAQEFIKKHGGTILAIGGSGGGPTQTHPITGFSGEPPKRVTIQGWESIDKVKGWQTDPEYVQLRKDVGEKHAKFRSYALETR